MNKYLIEILTALAIAIIVVLLVRMYSLEASQLIEIEPAGVDPEDDPEADPAAVVPMSAE